MDFLGAALSSVASILFLTMVIGGVYKLFQIASLLSEAKDLLADIKRNTNSHVSYAAPAAPAAHPATQITTLESAENLLRAVSEMDHPVPPVAESK